VKVVFLKGSRELIAQRMKTREHLMPPSLLESQLNTLEPPDGALVLDVGQPIELMVRDVIAQLQL
jgi:gluconokinase